jgi:TctA family transporter
MLTLWLVQVLLGVTTLLCAFVAGESALRNRPRAGIFFSLTGTFGFVFFLSLQSVPIGMVLIALLAAAAGAIFAPQLETLIDDIDIGDDSTATRHMKKR